MTDYNHTPVLLSEVLDLLNIKSGQNVVDATLGGAGYSKAILEKIGKTGNLLSIDLDYEAVKNAEEQKKTIKAPNWLIVHDNFRKVDEIVERHKFKNISAVVADLGLSSYQIDQGNRGISFQKKELLDMRFNTKGSTTDAKFILNNYDQYQLERIFKEFGEEKFSRQIVRKILEVRGKSLEVRYTADLYQLIVDALPKPVKHKADDSARRIFQALRVEVNHELDNLSEFLQKAFDLLVPGGRMAVVSFQSLEDRIVKKFFVDLARGCVCPLDFPECRCGKNPRGKILTKKIITASEDELKANSRSKAAKLRAIMKI